MNIRQWLEREADHIKIARKNTSPNEEFSAVLDGKSILWNRLRHDLDNGEITL